MDSEFDFFLGIRLVLCAPIRLVLCAPVRLVLCGKLVLCGPAANDKGKEEEGVFLYKFPELLSSTERRGMAGALLLGKLLWSDTTPFSSGEELLVFCFVA